MRKCTLIIHAVVLENIVVSRRCNAVLRYNEGQGWAEC